MVKGKWLKSRLIIYENPDAFLRSATTLSRGNLSDDEYIQCFFQRYIDY